EPVPTPASPEARQKIEELQGALAQARALWAAGRYPEGLALATRAAEGAKVLGHAPLVARLLVVRGIHEEETIHLKEAEATYHEAARAAEDARDDGTLADAWTRLVGVVGFKLQRPAEGLVWGRYAEAAIRRLGGDDQRELNLLDRMGLTLWSDG